SVPATLGARREARALHHDDRSGRTKAQRLVAGDAAGERAQLRTVRVGGADVDDVRPEIVRVRAAGRPVDELVADHQVARMKIRLQTADGRGPDDAAHTELTHRPDVRAVIDEGRRNRVARTMARQEGDAT